MGLCMGLFTASAFAQELNCDVSVPPSTVLKSVKKNVTVKRAIKFGASKSKLSARTVIAKASLYPATVLKLQGRVLLLERQGQRLADPIVLAVGSSLELGDTIETFEQSFISLELGDGVVSVLPSNSRIVLSQSDNKVARFILIDGRVESYVPKHQKAIKNTFEIQVPNAIVGVRGTHFLVSHSMASHQTKASVEDGTLWVRSRQMCRAPAVVEAGQGLNIDRLDSGSAAIVLLPAPTFMGLDEAQHGRETIFNLSQVDKATSYRVQMAKDADFIDIQREALSSSPNVKMNDDDLTNGFYYVRSSAIDSMGVEGQTDIRFFLKVHNQIKPNLFEP